MQDTAQVVKGREYQAQGARPIAPEEAADWLNKRGITPDENGIFTEMPYKADEVSAVREVIIENVKFNAARRDIPNLPPREHTPKTLVFVAGGPTLAQYLDAVKEKCADDRYDVITSNKTGRWLVGQGIIPNYHLILDPQPSKIKDIDYP